MGVLKWRKWAAVLSQAAQFHRHLFCQVPCLFVCPQYKLCLHWSRPVVCSALCCCPVALQLQLYALPGEKDMGSLRIMSADTFDFLTCSSAAFSLVKKRYSVLSFQALLCSTWGFLGHIWFKSETNSQAKWFQEEKNHAVCLGQWCWAFYAGKMKWPESWKLETRCIPCCSFALDIAQTNKQTLSSSV